jgi:hypothetical protein
MPCAVLLGCNVVVELKNLAVTFPVFREKPMVIKEWATFNVRVT